MVGLSVYRKYFAQDKSLRHYTEHLFADIIGICILFIDTKVISLELVILFIVFSYLIDIDALATLIFFRKKYSGFYNECIAALKQGRLSEAGNVCVRRHKEIDNLVVHNFLGLAIVLILLFYFMIVVPDPTLVYIFGGITSHLLFDLGDDILQIKTIDHWIWPLRKILNNFK